ncbi:ABC-three component system protein [Vibrio parahaemolyticus]|uniref:ABC-three component system protein n=2 Tax=Vibrio parahaemolyticus TaxID=670 RepID=UPI00046F3FC6|nr:ABC-three component system protein [Vibrio parahaemolyticus]
MAEQLRRAQVNDTVKMSLLSEVQGKCPLCRKSLIKRKKASNVPVRVFDVAHIYPLNATAREIELLANEEKLCEDIDSEGNFIALCKECHKIYDTKKTIDEYRQLVEIKKAANRIRALTETWDTQTLHKDISIVAEKIGQLSQDELADTQLSYNALKVSDKTDNTFGAINEMKVNTFVINYFAHIKESLKRLEMQRKASSLFICNQVRTFYTALLLQNFSQSEIFEHMCEWFMVNTGINERTKAEVLVSYFIQNCEIFSDDNAE